MAPSDTNNPSSNPNDLSARAIRPQDLLTQAPGRFTEISQSVDEWLPLEGGNDEQRQLFKQAVASLPEFARDLMRRGNLKFRIDPNTDNSRFASDGAVVLGMKNRQTIDHLMEVTANIFGCTVASTVTMPCTQEQMAPAVQEHVMRELVDDPNRNQAKDLMLPTIESIKRKGDLHAATLILASAYGDNYSVNPSTGRRLAETYNGQLPNRQRFFEQFAEAAIKTAAGEIPLRAPNQVSPADDIIHI